MEKLLRKQLLSKSLLILLIILSVSAIALAEDEVMIKEIVIIGPTRSSEDLISKQLPFSKGDIWEESYLELIESRVKALNIFNPMDFKVLAETIEDNQVRVVIRANDTSILYTDPVEFAIMKAVYLKDKSLVQEFRNPIANGLNITAGFSWDENSWWALSLQYPLKDGFIAGLQQKGFDKSSLFNRREYSETGKLTGLSLKHIMNNELQFKYNLNYLDNFYNPPTGDKLNQRYLDFSFNTIWQRNGKMLLGYTHGHSLQSEQPDYDKLTLEYFLKKDVEFADLVFRISGGIASKETPLNRQFHGGGFSSIALRGYSYNMAGDRFLQNTIEIHRHLKESFKLILFSDLGKIVAVEQKFKKADFLISGGVGLSYDTPLQIPVRLDIVVNKEGDISCNMGFGHSY